MTSVSGEDTTNGQTSRSRRIGSEAAPTVSVFGLVLFTLASAQFLMTLDMSVMNVSIATVANDLGTTVTGIQTAITFCTLVSLFFTGRLPATQPRSRTGEGNEGPRASERAGVELD